MVVGGSGVVDGIKVVVGNSGIGFSGSIALLPFLWSFMFI